MPVEALYGATSKPALFLTRAAPGVRRELCVRAEKASGALR
jgi:hypothetical protein